MTARSAALRVPAAVWRAAALAACAAGVLGAPAVADAQSASLVTVGVDATHATPAAATYSLLVVNHGNATAQAVELTNTVPDNASFASSDRPPSAPAGGTPCAPGAPAGTECRWTLGAIPPGGSHTVSVTYALAQVDAAYGEVHTFANTASAQAAGDASAESNTDESLVRTSHVLDEDAHVDDSRPSLNFGACPQLMVRRDTALTAFLEADKFSLFGYPFAESNRDSGLGGVERLWHAQLRAAVVSAPATGVPVAVHRVASGDWREGTGGCAGAAGTGDDARGGEQPESESAAVATAAIGGPGPVSWDVRGAFDTVDERNGFNGFELRAEGPVSVVNGGDTVTFHASESTSADDRPRLVTLATRIELDRCIDNDPETSLTRSDTEQRIDAYVTDGGGRLSGAGGDGCPGHPVPGAPVGWEVDDDSPDAYVASRAGSPTTREVGSFGDAAPNEASTRADSAGRTFVTVRLAEPYRESAGDGETRVAAIVIDQHHDGYGSFPPGGDVSGTCEPGETQGTGNVPRECPSTTGESATEDDAHVHWGYVAAPPIDGDGGAGTGGAGTGGTGAGTAGAPAGATSPPEPVSRSITVTSSRRRAALGRTVTLAGRLSSGAAACAGPREFVEILRRRRGARELTPFASVSTAVDGAFELPMVVDVSAEYVALVPARAGCRAASSDAVGVVGFGRVHAWVAGPTLVRRGGGILLRGRILPALAGSVVLERRVGRRWLRAGAAVRVSRRGSFSFSRRAMWGGGRAFRARWRPPSPSYAGGVSRTLTVRTAPRR